MPWKERLLLTTAAAVIVVAFVRNPLPVAGFWMTWGAATGAAVAITGCFASTLQRRGMVGRLLAGTVLVLAGVVPTLLMMVLGVELPR
jgi:hypothetical protein